MESKKINLYELNEGWCRDTYQLWDGGCEHDAIRTDACDEDGNLYYVYYDTPEDEDADWQEYVENEVDFEHPAAVRLMSRADDDTCERYATEDGYTVIGSLRLFWGDVSDGGADAVRRELERQEKAK